MANDEYYFPEKEFLTKAPRHSRKTSFITLDSFSQNNDFYFNMYSTDQDCETSNSTLQIIKS